jgi:hypothetical protein
VITRIAKLALLLALAVASTTDVVMLSWSALYNGDEIFNLDAILTFFLKGDYTTAQFGGYPFDPAISSGVLATWPFGAAMLAGANLFDARLACALPQMAVTVVLAFLMARRLGLLPLDAALFGMALWASLTFVGNHDLRVINPGEVWGFAFLAGGGLLAERRPHAAAFCWGLAAWLCKIVYLPFGAALVAAAAVARATERGNSPVSAAALADVLRLGLAFLAPLLLWMGLIWRAYDLATVLDWTRANAVFVVRHATGVPLDYASSGAFKEWRFEPGWGPQAPFLSHSRNVTLPTVIPLLAGIAALPFWLAARNAARVPLGRNERAYLAALFAIITVFTIWFFSGTDPTQWQRHLLPAIYASIAIAAYCTLDTVRALGIGPRWRQALGLAACTVLLWYVGPHVADEVERFGWQASYARACSGTNVLRPPCQQDSALKTLEEWTRDICQLADRPWDQDCMQRKRTLFLDRAVEIAAAHSADPPKQYAAAYIPVFIEQWAYSGEREFNADLGPRLCTLASPLVWSYFEETGADVAAMKAACPAA